MAIAELITQSAEVIGLVMLITYVIALRKKDNSIVDIAYGIAFALAAIFAYLAGMHSLRSFLLTTLVLVWGARLSLHIHLRHHGEDVRYAKWRKKWQWFSLRSLVQIFLFQGLVILIVMLPVLLAAADPDPTLGWFGALGLLVWTVGFALEAAADAQLRMFKAIPKNKGKICTVGLWRYSRHPNYFGEILMWWGIFVIALPVENGPLGIVSPVLLTFLLMRVSGVKMADERYKGNKEYERYKKTTNALVPWKK